MDKKQEFKNFVKDNNYLIKHVKDGNMTWQKFYELYDLYGSDNEIWDDYREEKSVNKTASSTITDFVKKVDSDSIQKHIGTAQKALELIKDLTAKDGVAGSVASLAKGPLSSRPISKIFED